MKKIEKMTLWLRSAAGENESWAELSLSADGSTVVVLDSDDPEAAWLREYLDRPEAVREVARTLSEGVHENEWDASASVLRWMLYGAFVEVGGDATWVFFETYFGGIDSDGIRMHRNTDAATYTLVTAWLASFSDARDVATMIAAADEADETIVLAVDFSETFVKN